MKPTDLQRYDYEFNFETGQMSFFIDERDGEWMKADDVLALFETNGALAKEDHACSTGDCGHSFQRECDDQLKRDYPVESNGAQGLSETLEKIKEYSVIKPGFNASDRLVQIRSALMKVQDRLTAKPAQPKSIDECLAEITANSAKILEDFSRAYLAETGLKPSEVTMTQRHLANGIETSFSTKPAQPMGEFDEDEVYEAARKRTEQFSRMGSFIQGARWMFDQLTGRDGRGDSNGSV